MDQFPIFKLLLILSSVGTSHLETPLGWEDKSFKRSTDQYTTEAHHEMSGSIDQLRQTRMGVNTGVTMQSTDYSGDEVVEAIDNSDNTIEYSSKYYKVMYSRNENDNKCTEQIRIQGLRTAFTHTINDEFQPQCKEGVIRSIYTTDSTVLVGGIEQNICVYGQEDLYRQLVIIQDGKCVIKTYSYRITRTQYNYLDESLCKRVKRLIKSVQDVLENPNPGSGEVKTKKKSILQLAELVHKVTGAAATVTGGSQHGLLMKLRIFIKNIFMGLRLRSTNYE